MDSDLLCVGSYSPECVGSPPYLIYQLIQQMSSQPLLFGTVGILGAYLSHQYDIGYFYTLVKVNFINKGKKFIFGSTVGTPQKEAHRFLQWYVTPTVVTTRDLDSFWHMNNGRYNRKGDFARFKLLFATRLVEAVQALGTWFLVSANSQKFRRELPNQQNYEIWARIVGWDKRHFYVEHVFCYAQHHYPSSQKQPADKPQSRSSAYDKIEHIEMDCDSLTVQNVVRHRELELRSRGLIIASILTVRLTTARTSTGGIVTPEDVIKQLGLNTVLPSISLPPQDIQAWNDSVEASSSRLVKGLPLRSKL